MKTAVPISKARRQLPRLVKQLQRNPDAVYIITVRGEVLAELRGVRPGPQPGLAARRLLEIMARLPKPRGKARTNVAGHVNRYLYGRGGVIR